MYHYEVEYRDKWQNHFYMTKQVAPVVAEKIDEVVVVTVYVFYH